MPKTPIGFYIEFNDQFTGGPRVLANLVDRLDRDRFEPVVVTNKASPLVDVLRGNGVEPVILEQPGIIGEDDGLSLGGGMMRKFAAWRALRTYNRRVYDVFQKHGVKLVWVRNIKGVLLTQRATGMLRIPLIWDIGMEKKSQGVIWCLHTLGFITSSCVIAEGEYVYPSIFTPWQLKTFSW